ERPGVFRFRTPAMLETQNLRVVDTTLLQPPSAVTAELPLTPRAAEVVVGAREEIQRSLDGKSRRLLAIVGPCSIHDPEAALEYARKLVALRERVASELVLVMRVYFEKPRTTVGWKGLINDPHLDGSYDIPTGIRRARKLLRDIAELGMPAATEMLDPIIPQYIADLVSWSAIGARTTESQTHREMASGLSMPVGFKNGTDGSFGVAVNAMIAASQPHSFLGIDENGRVGVVRTAGNPYTHLVLRGGSGGPNFDGAAVARADAALAKAGVSRRVLIDASHDNSGKNAERQPFVLTDVGSQLRQGSESVLGVMLESHLVAGRQDLKDKSKLVYGQSLPDACIDFPTTERAIVELAEAAAARRTVETAATG
ncbi:MAG TPA: 3-deoxy-7-phosphoheptulonate synthase, partial [Polyangiaceae bacterium]|nr:3-deoxy-7-phosphoheptulonate synthase [Polyangiaceae bacterium]